MLVIGFDSKNQNYINKFLIVYGIDFDKIKFKMLFGFTNIFCLKTFSKIQNLIYKIESRSKGMKVEMLELTMRNIKKS